jgi:hypothetical protein
LDVSWRKTQFLAINPYVYAKDNPVNLADPSGMCVPDVTCREPITNKEGRVHWPTHVYHPPKPRPTPEGEKCVIIATDQEIPWLSDWACSDEKAAEVAGNWLDENISPECAQELVETWAEDQAIEGVQSVYDLTQPQWLEFSSWVFDTGIAVLICDFGVHPRY